MKTKQEIFDISVESFRENFLELCTRLLTRNFREDYHFLYDDLHISCINSKEDFDDYILWHADDIGDVNFYDIETDLHRDTEYGGYRNVLLDQWETLKTPLSEKKEIVKWYNRADRYRMDGVLECMIHDTKSFRDVLFTNKWIKTNNIETRKFGLSDSAMWVLGHCYSKKLDVQFKKELLNKQK